MSDRLDVEARLVCPSCHGVPYLLIRRPVSPGSPIHQHDLSPQHGAPIPASTSAPVCPRCQVGLQQGPA